MLHTKTLIFNVTLSISWVLSHQSESAGFCLLWANLGTSFHFWSVSFFTWKIYIKSLCRTTLWGELQSSRPYWLFPREITTLLTISLLLCLKNLSPGPLSETLIYSKNAGLEAKQVFYGQAGAGRLGGNVRSVLFLRHNLCSPSRLS